MSERKTLYTNVAVLGVLAAVALFLLRSPGGEESAGFKILRLWVQPFLAPLVAAILAFWGFRRMREKVVAAFRANFSQRELTSADCELIKEFYPCVREQMLEPFQSSGRHSEKYNALFVLLRIGADQDLSLALRNSKEWPDKLPHLSQDDGERVLKLAEKDPRAQLGALKWFLCESSADLLLRLFREHLTASQEVVAELCTRLVVLQGLPYSEAVSFLATEQSKPFLRMRTEALEKLIAEIKAGYWGDFQSSLEAAGAIDGEEGRVRLLNLLSDADILRDQDKYREIDRVVATLNVLILPASFHAV